MKPLALTMGDPAGIGGELTAAAWQALREVGPAFLVLDDPERLRPLCPVATIETPAAATKIFGKALPVLSIPLPSPPVPGHPNSEHATQVVASIEQATALAMRGEVGAIVTNPINKAVLYAAGFSYPGHTEFLAALTGVSRPEMMLVSPELRVVPVTIHVSLREALQQLSAEAIVAASRTTAAALRQQFAIARPRLAIAGLNPHAGEGGTMGQEEITVIRPAIDALQAEGIDASGPWPPDTMFTCANRTRYDAAICMYHDQALIPLKTLDMHNGVNVTLGLPIVRTSPDHGTAYDIAGKGVADHRSLIAAIRLAAQLAPI
jgi:4-hydroxythreonine-4-phosphate dehydrogenase